jgi:hypothetical protein
MISLRRLTAAHQTLAEHAGRIADALERIAEEPAPLIAEAPPELTLEQRSRRFNETTGANGYISAAGRTGANHHPDRCSCQGTDTTPHKHYPEPPFLCGRCTSCTGFFPAVDSNLQPLPETQ